MDPIENSGAPTPAPGWYPDPSGAPAQRYWDGHSWTSHSAGQLARPAPAARRGWVTWAVAIACAILLVVFLALWINRPSRQGQPGQPGQSGQRTAAMVYQH